MTSAVEKALISIENYLLSHLDETLDHISAVYHYDHSLTEVFVYLNDEDTVNVLFDKPYDFAQATSQGTYNLDHKYVYFNNGGKLCSMSEYDWITNVKHGISAVAVTLLDYKDEIELSTSFTLQRLFNIAEEAYRENQNHE